MASTATRPVVDRGRMPVARRDRRPALAALALLLVLVGALGSALLVFRSGDRESVLVASRDIPFGSVITRADFRTARAATDEGHLFQASRIGEIEGLRATSTIPAGTLVSPQMFTVDTLVPDGGEAVGVVVDPNRRPSDVPEAGEVVRLYYVASGGAANTDVPDNPVVVDAARVIGTGAGSDSGTESVTVLVESDAAADVANYASTGNLAMTVLPDDTKPAIDWTNR
ncbi:SAF domain-containing protein [Nocardioides sp. CER19]|uniref:SAF domain-containing protein n=1 Tax=Nocardioides sp. CER19 TaxID=3038538 RepID=UPI00244AE43F|nr:SAF domain-containing protein [Nocardioides sp. CER19]MDH2413231.1 SAF domain-containing protein [Nocardioides sp. CER19]